MARGKYANIADVLIFAAPNSISVGNNTSVSWCEAVESMPSVLHPHRRVLLFRATHPIYTNCYFTSNGEARKLSDLSWDMVSPVQPEFDCS